MSQERLPNPVIASLEALAYQTKEQWEKNWQDQNFTKAFPTCVQQFVEEQYSTKLSKEQKKAMFESAVESYFGLAWGPGGKGCIAVNGLLFTSEGKVIYASRSILPNVDSLARAEIACLLPFGFILVKKDHVKRFIINTYNDLSYSKKGAFRSNVFLLARDKNASRTWIKTNRLDALCGFDWDEEIGQLALQLPAPSTSPMPNEDELRMLPRQLTEDLNVYATKALQQFIKHVVEYIKNPPTKIRPSQKRVDILMLFTLRLKELKPEVRASINPELLNQVESLLAKR